MRRTRGRIRRKTSVVVLTPRGTATSGRRTEPICTERCAQGRRLNEAPINLRDWTAKKRIARARRRVDLAEMTTADVAESAAALRRLALAMGDESEQAVAWRDRQVQPRCLGQYAWPRRHAGRTQGEEGGLKNTACPSAAAKLLPRSVQGLAISQRASSFSR